MKLKDDFLTIFDSTLSFFRALSRPFKVFQGLFSIIFKSTLLHPASQNALRSWWQQNLGNSLGSLMPKRSNDSYLQKNQELQTTCTFCMTCQVSVVNKQLILPQPVFKKILMAYLQTCRCRGKIYPHVKNNFVYTLLIYPFYILFCLTKQIPI